MREDGSDKIPLSKSRRSFLATASLGVAAGVGHYGFAHKVKRQTEKAWHALSMLVWDLFGAPEDRKRYNVDRTLRAAVELQPLGKETACEVLSSFAKRLPVDPLHHWYREESLIALIRMVFLGRADGKFRRAMIGAAGFLGRTGYDDWPLEPIEIIDGVPFFIVCGYELGGVAEPASSYIAYCIENCDWNSFQFRIKTEAEKQQALGQLLASPKFKTPLSDWEKELLLEQIR